MSRNVLTFPLLPFNKFTEYASSHAYMHIKHSISDLLCACSQEQDFSPFNEHNDLQTYNSMKHRCAVTSNHFTRLDHISF